MGSVKNPRVQAAFQSNLRVQTQRQNSLSRTRDRCAVPRASPSLSGEEDVGRPLLAGGAAFSHPGGICWDTGVSATWGRDWSRLCKLGSGLPFHS